MADFFSGSLQSRAAQGNFQSMAGSPAYESRYISFDEFIRSKGPEAAMRARDPISFRGLWSEYSNRYPQSARIAVTQDAFRQMGGESPIEQGLRQSRDYQSYMQQMKAAGAEEFMLTPQSFAASDVRKREKGRETMQEFYKGRGTGEPVGDMSPDVPFKKKGAEAMVKVPVGPRGELQLDKAGQPATRFRTLPQSEVDRLKMEQGARGLAEERLKEDIAMQGDQPRLARQEEELAGIQDTAQIRSELGKFQELVSMDEKIAQDPEYASFMNQGFSAVRGGMSAENALKYVKGLGGVGAVKEERQRERERLREAARSDLARTERDFKIDYYQWKAGQDQAIRDAQSSGDRQGVAMRAQAAYDDLRAHTGALQRGIDALRAKISRAKEDNERSDIESQISTLQSELDDARQSMSYYMSIRNSEPAAPTQVAPFPRPYEGQPEGYQGERPRPGFVIVKTQYGKREVSQSQFADIERALKAAGQQYEVIR
jgi:hypothetical protein